MLRRMLVVVLIGSSLACSGSNNQADNASTFTGHWVGDNALDQAPVILQPGDQFSAVAIVPAAFPLDVTTTDLNTIAISGVCASFNGSVDDLVVMDVTGPSTLAGTRHTCLPDSSAGPNCTTPNSIVIDGGSGSYASGGLALALTGTYTSCGKSMAFTYRFSGVKN